MKIKKSMKKILAILMALALALVSLPLTVAAAGEVCKIGDQHYSSIAAAVSAAKDGDVIDVYADTSISAVIAIGAKDITLTSSNGSTINCSKTYGLTVGGNAAKDNTIAATLTLNGNLRLESSVSSPIIVEPYSTLNVEGDVYLEATGNYLIENYSAGVGKVIINIKGGTLTTKNGAADKSVVGLFTGEGSELNISGGKIIQTVDGAYAVKINDANLGTVNITGGELTAPQKTIQCYGGGTAVKYRTINISGGSVIAENGYAIFPHTNSKYVNINISDDAYLEAKNNTIAAEANYNVNITGGKIVAKESVAITGSGASDTTVTISENAKIYAGKQALVASEGLTFNVSGGLIDVSNEYTPDDISSQYAVVTNSGNVNITGGKFIVGGSNNAAQVIYQGGNSTGTTTVNGGLFINNNTANTTIFSDKVNYVKGNIIYGENITNINSTTEATKGVTVKYEDNDYNFYTRYAATDAEKGEMLDGASVRLTAGSTGLRFTSEFAYVDGATYGTIIVPASYLATIDAFTVEALTTKYGENGFLNIVANDGKDVVGDTVTIRAAITNLDTYDNYGTIFAAVSYVIIDGEYYYTAFDMANNARSVEYVANEALADTEADYTEAQRAILQGFLRQD
ncbi:MAG: hypothetical protein IJZ83_06850 [Clostridia bacterium]|nr:hypothetical protein [Clostridia bacterium]